MKEQDAIMAPQVFKNWSAIQLFQNRKIQFYINELFIFLFSCR